MRVILKSIEIQNFKSYKGKFVIDPLKSFTGVVGPNGSGKSNFMDAISFVMGENTTSLRVKKLNDLIHGASVGKPVSDVASVAAVFRLDDHTEKKFMRIVHDSSSQHQIDGNDVTSQAYLTELRALKINVKAKNFLVFQGSVESIAMKNPTELTALFEEISGSVRFKTEYERLKLKMIKAEEDTHFLHQKKKGMAADKKEAELEKKEAEYFQQLQHQYEKKNIEMQLFRLYHSAKALENLAIMQREKLEQLAHLEEMKQVDEIQLNNQKKDVTQTVQQLAFIDERLRDAEAEITKIKPTYTQANENVAHLREKVESIRKCLEQARAAAIAHKNEIRQLEAVLNEMEAAKATYDASVAGQEQIGAIQLGSQQIQEYNNLKEKAATLCAVKLDQLNSINRLLKSDEDRLENEIRKKNDLTRKINQLSLMQDKAKEREEKLNENIVLIKADLDVYHKEKNEIESGVHNSSEIIVELQRELKTISEQLADATLDTNELARIKKKNQVVAALKERFPGVYDRLLNMCEPNNKRYNIAITKVFGKFMDAIVVDTEHTSRQCIRYLKDQCLEPEIFLPLDYIQVKPIKERLRMIKEPHNVKLLFDVLKFSPRDIERAVLFVTRNTLVCETPEDARRVAYDMDPSTHYDCVALDGTFYQRSGIMSGGSLDLAKRAKRWDEKQIAQVELQKKKVTERLKDELLTSRKTPDLGGLVSKINGAESRLKYLEVDLKQSINQIAQNEVELKDLKSELDKLESIIAVIEESVASKKLEMENIKQELNAQEDKVFRDFCVKIGVSNISEYRERELPVQQERLKKRMEFDNQCTRITSQLDFERQRDTEKNISRWVNNLEDAENELEMARQVAAPLKEAIDTKQVEIEELHAERNKIKKILDEKQEGIGAMKKRVSKLAKDILSAQRQLNGIQAKIEGLKDERHAILVNCKVGGIKIPMLDGNQEDVATQSSSGGDDTHSDSSREQDERESQFAIDYGLLANDLKEIEGEDIGRTENNLRKALDDIQSTLEKIQDPNMKADERLAVTMENFQKTNAEFEAARKNAREIKKRFEIVQENRRATFVEYLDHVVKEIDGTYKGLTKNRAAQAFLTAENVDEPYLAGINYHCVVPGKRFLPMSCLSGGEKTVAALALLFAIHSTDPAPFLVLDEVDAALDNTNINKVARFIRKKSYTLQTIVISLKPEFYGYAETLLGINPAVDGDCIASDVLTFDLLRYEL